MSGEGLVYRPSQFRRVLVQDDTRLKEVVAELDGSEALGVDLEMGQRLERRPGGIQEWINILGLIQIASDTLSAVIDPLRCRDLSVLGPLMSGPIRKAFLGGGQDVALLERTGIPARHIVDVGETAYALFGRRQDGMAALADRIFGISLDKTVRRADWLARPLNPVLLTYAHRDAELTLLIYYWLREHYPAAVALHERAQLEPSLPPDTPAWLKAAMERPSADAVGVVMEHSLEPQKDTARLSADVVALMGHELPPRQLNRLVRVATDLGLTGALPAILPLAQSRSSLVRASTARAVGQLGTEEEAPLLERMKGDEVPDVASAAQSALKALRRVRPEPPPEPEEEETGLDDVARSALERLRAQLEEAEE